MYAEVVISPVSDSHQFIPLFFFIVAFREIAVENVDRAFGVVGELLGGLLGELAKLGGSSETELLTSTVRALEDARAALVEEAEALRLRAAGRDAEARARAEQASARYRGAVELPWISVMRGARSCASIARRLCGLRSMSIPTTRPRPISLRSEA